MTVGPKLQASPGQFVAVQDSAEIAARTWAQATTRVVEGGNDAGDAADL